MYFSKTSVAFQKALRDVCFHVSKDNRLINEVTIHQTVYHVCHQFCNELPMKLMFVKNSLVMGISVSSCLLFCHQQFGNVVIQNVIHVHQCNVIFERSTLYQKCHIHITDQ